MVLVPGIGAEINGSRRWIVIPGVGTLQPAEFAKLAVVLYLAHWLDRRGKAAGSLSTRWTPKRATATSSCGWAIGSRPTK